MNQGNFLEKDKWNRLLNTYEDLSSQLQMKNLEYVMNSQLKEQLDKKDSRMKKVHSNIRNFLLRRIIN